MKKEELWIDARYLTCENEACPIVVFDPNWWAAPDEECPHCRNKGEKITGE